MRMLRPWWLGDRLLLPHCPPTHTTHPYTHTYFPADRALPLVLVRVVLVHFNSKPPRVHSTCSECCPLRGG